MSSSKLQKARERIDASHKETRQRLKELELAISQGDAQQQRQLIRWLTTNPIAVVSHAMKANAVMPMERRASLELLTTVPELTTADAPIGELVEMYLKPRAGGFRVIHDFGIVHRSLQRGIREVASRYFHPRPFQYTHLGVPYAVRAARQSLLEGCHYVAELDISKFYSSYEEKRLLNEFTIPHTVELPEGLVRNAVFSRRYEARWKKDTARNVPHYSLLGLEEEARSGISTGSGCSPIIGMITVSKLAWLNVPGASLVNYADNFLLLASSDVLLKKAISELKDAIEQLPGGHFQVKQVVFNDPKRGFDFLGHSLRIDGDVVHIEPNDGNFHSFCAECDRRDTRIGELLFNPQLRAPWKGVKLAVRELRFIAGFMSAFRECDPSELEFYEHQFDEVLKMLAKARISCKMLTRAFGRTGSVKIEYDPYL